MDTSGCSSDFAEDRPKRKVSPRSRLPSVHDGGERPRWDDYGVAVEPNDRLAELHHLSQRCSEASRRGQLSERELGRRHKLSVRGDPGNATAASISATLAAMYGYPKRPQAPARRFHWRSCPGCGRFGPCFCPAGQRHRSHIPLHMECQVFAAAPPSARALRQARTAAFAEAHWRACMCDVRSASKRARASHAPVDTSYAF